MRSLSSLHGLHYNLVLDVEALGLPSFDYDHDDQCRKWEHSRLKLSNPSREFSVVELDSFSEGTMNRIEMPEGLKYCKELENPKNNNRKETIMREI